MKESTEEKKFVRELKRDLNIRAVKFHDDSRRGAPDRLVILPQGDCMFVEFKLPGEKLREEQVDYHAFLESWGHEVVTCWSAEYAKKRVADTLDRIVYAGSY